MISSAARIGRRRRKGKEAIIESREGERELHAAAAVDVQNWVTQSPRRVRAGERAKERGARGAPSQLQGREGKRRRRHSHLLSSSSSCAIRPSVAAEETGFPFPFSCCGRRRTNQRRTNEPPMIVLHDATPTNVRTPTIRDAARRGASQDKLAKRGKTYLRQFSIHPFSPPPLPYRQR